MKNIKIYILWLIVAFLGTGIVFLTIGIATSGAEMAKLEKEEASLARENSELNQRVLGSTSLSGLEKKATDLEFVKPEKVVYLGLEAPIAKLP